MHGVEVAVISDRPQCRPHGRIHGAVRELGGAQRRADRGREQLADRDCPALGPVQPAQLGVLAEAAAGAIDPIQLVLENPPRRTELTGAGQDELCAGSESPEGHFGDHRYEPLETTTGGAAVGAGGAGGGASATLAELSSPAEGAGSPALGGTLPFGGGVAPLGAFASAVEELGLAAWEIIPAIAATAAIAMTIRPFESAETLRRPRSRAKMRGSDRREWGRGLSIESMARPPNLGVVAKPLIRDA